jgi:RHS repeat-associated protein
VTYAATDFDGTELYEFSDSSSPTPVYLERDAHDDVTWTHDESGTPTSHAAYDPFGNLVSGSTTLSATRWQSSYQDDSSGLYYVIARWYAPTLGRFLSDDPLTADATTPEARNPYPYAAGDPIDGSDPSGQATLKDGGVDRQEAIHMAQCHTYDLNACNLVTDLVSHMYEPLTWKNICGPGAMRIVLAFTASASTITADGNLAEASSFLSWGTVAHPKKIYNKNGTFYYQRAHWKQSDQDGMGTAFMIYLANHVTTCPSGTVTNRSEDVVTYLNSLSGANPSKKVADQTQWFSFVSTPGDKIHAGTCRQNSLHTCEQSTFTTDIESEIEHGVPAMVDARMNYLPSQAMFDHNGQNHWVSVVAYDSNYYYYIDTCLGYNNCGSPSPHSFSAAYDPYINGKANTATTDPYLSTTGSVHGSLDFSGGTSLSYRTLHPGTWRISKSDLWRALTDPTTERGYIKDTGLTALNPAGD